MLYRSNAQSRVIESALFNAGLPYRVYGGLRFFERAEIKHALAYLRLIENPDDDTSFLRVVNFPTRGIGARTVEQLQDLARGEGRSLYRATAALQGRSAGNVARFVALVEDLRETTRGLTLRAIIERVLDQTGLVDAYRSEKEGQDRIENLQELVNAAESFVTQEGFGKDAVAMPIDEQAPARGARARGARRRHRRDPVAAGGFPHPCLARGRRQPGAGRAGCDPADDGACGQGAGVRRRLHHRPRGRALPARELDVRPATASRKSAG